MEEIDQLLAQTEMIEKVAASLQQISSTLQQAQVVQLVSTDALEPEGCMAFHHARPSYTGGDDSNL